MNRLKELRLKKEFSQKEFAKAFNKYLLKANSVKDTNGKVKKISYATVSRWENEQTLIPPIYLSGLANFFDVSVPYLQGLDKDMNGFKFPTKKEAIKFIKEIMKNLDISKEELERSIDHEQD